MPQRNGAAIHIHALRIEPKRAHHGQHLRREGFVQLDQANVVERQSGAAQSFGIAVTGPMPISSGRQPVTA